MLETVVAISIGGRQSYSQSYLYNERKENIIHVYSTVRSIDTTHKLNGREVLINLTQRYK